MVRILCLDGGGMKGLIPALFLAELEKRCRKPVSQLFDFIVGTSTGGIIALAVNLPSPNHPGMPLYTATDVADLYRFHGKQIFPRNFWKRIKLLSYLSDEKYHADGLEKVLQTYFGLATINQSITDVMVTSYDIERREAFFFKFFHGFDQTGLQNVPLWEAARCTTAGPTFFEPYKIITTDAIGYRVLIDGGVFANNPALCAYCEAKRRYHNQEILLVSVGSGKMHRPYRYEKVKDMSQFRWAYPIVDIMMNGTVDMVDYQMQQLMEANENYFRFQPVMDPREDDWDNASDEHIAHLEQVSQNLVTANENTLVKLCGLLNK